jgi:putative ABC transport system permease protein
VLPTGVEAVTGKAITKESQDQIAKALSFFNTFLLIFAAIALLVGGFMMFNTFAITVAQRTRENGLLRALGASRRQVMGSVLAEAVGVGAIASLLGVGAGIVVAVGLKSLMAAIGIEIPAAGVVISPRSMLIAFCTGLIVTVLSAISPARKAAKVSPIAAMQLGVAGSSGYGSKQRILVGLAVSVAGIATLLLGLFGDVPRQVQLIGLGALLVFFGVSILGRTIALPLSRGIGWPLARARGVTGELARENAMRNPKRTAASASALMIGVGVVGLITIFVASIHTSVEHSINNTFTGDVVVDSGGGLAGGVDPAIVTRLNGVAQVDVAAGLRSGLAKIGGSGVIVSASEPDKLLKVMDIKAKSGSASDLGTDGLAVFSKVASDHNWRVGSTVDAAFAKTGQQRMRIALIYGDNTQLGSYFMTTAAYEANFAAQFDHEVFVKIAPDTNTTTAVRAIEQVTRDYPGVKVLTRSQYVDNQMKPLDQLLSLVYALLGLAIIIALLGIANTLTLSISERVREIGLLRAVGMTRAQLRSMIRWESVIIALQGTFLGLLIGIFFGWALVRALHDQGITEFTIPVTSLVIIVVAACVAGMLAAITPGRRAARLDLLKAVVSE